MIVMSLDLEFTQPTQKIIEVGYAIGDTSTGELLYKDFSFCNPQEQLTEFISKLTSIQQWEVDTGGTVKDAYEKMLMYHTQYECAMHLITWGGGDTQALREQASMSDVKWRYGRRFTDVKTVWCAYAMANSLKAPGGLSKSMSKLGLQFKGTKHRAVDDAVNTFYMYSELLKRMKK